ncbi:MAG: tRNA pseudouridine(55) synthase TruB [Mariprofundales bacterium]
MQEPTSTSLPCGVIFLDKPSGMTSRYAVNIVSKLYAIKKAGHTGTLDPLASGMLPILLGDATRFADLGLKNDKSYEVTINFSYSTDSLDSDGMILNEFETSSLNLATVQLAIISLLGKQEQVPPIFSAIRIDGKRAHAQARAGKPVVLMPRHVQLYSCDILNFTAPSVTLRLRCSAGFYVRALARDLGEKLGMGGCVTSLRRLSIGQWQPSEMRSIAQLKQDKQSCIAPLSHWLSVLTKVELNLVDAHRFAKGQRLPHDIGSFDESSGIQLVVFYKEVVLGLAEMRSGMTYDCVLHPKKVLASAVANLR